MNFIRAIRAIRMGLKVSTKFSDKPLSIDEEGYLRFPCGKKLNARAWFVNDDAFRVLSNLSPEPASGAKAVSPDNYAAAVPTTHVMKLS